MGHRRRLEVALLFATCSAAVLACGGTGDGTGFGDGGNGLPDVGAHGPDTGHVTTGGGDAGRDGATVSPGNDGGHDTGTGTHDGSAHLDSSFSMDAGHDTGSSHDTGTGIQDVSTPPPHDSGFPQVAVVYGQSATVLYSVDPITKAVTTIGNFGGACLGDEVIDIALDSASNMYATGFAGVYTVDTTTAVCTLIASGSYPNSLSFVPVGTLDPNVEALVGYTGSNYVRIDTTTGAITTVGSLGSQGYASSGDIVSVIGGGTYLTVTGGPDSCGDCLVEVNPKTGALITDYGSVQHSSVFGIAFWAGNVYGFDSAGDLFEVTFPDAGGLAITDIPIPNAPPGLSFYGAGSTTSAPRK